MNKQRTLLSILKTAVYSQTISDIADRLYLSQPYISKVLKEAEKEYQTTLITRKTKPIHLTNAGDIMLKGLQTIIDDEDHLEKQLGASLNQEKPALNILITNPFLSSLASDALSDYHLQHPNQKFNVIMATNEHSDNNAIDETIDLIIGKRSTDAHFKTVTLPVQQLFLFISKNCRVFKHDKILLPFHFSDLTAFNNYRFIGFSGYPAFQNYVQLSFQKEGINLIQTITVPSAPEALRAAEKIPESGTITTAELAEQTFGQGNYNLIPLPEKFISIANTISYRVTADRDIVALVGQLQAYFEQHTGKLTADATTN